MNDTQHKLRELADRLDALSNWRLSWIEQQKLPQEQRDRLEAGINLRRYADLMGPGRWLVIPPEGLGPTQFSAGTLSAAARMAGMRINTQLPFAVFDEFGKSADDRVQDLAFAAAYQAGNGLREALRRIKYDCSSLAQAQAVAIDALRAEPVATITCGLSKAKEREAFEKWFLSDGGGKREWLDLNDEYAIDTWEAWQARAALAASAPSQAAQDAARYRYLRDNSATYTSPKVPIQLIVQECADVHRTHGATGYRRGLDEAIDALMGGAPSQAEPAEIDYDKLVWDAWANHKYRQGSGACIAFKHGAEWQAAQAASAPTGLAASNTASSRTLTDDAEAWAPEQLDGIASAVREACGPATAARVRAILAASSTTAGDPTP